jgi:lactoylglutathione lyase
LQVLYHPPQKRFIAMRAAKIAIYSLNPAKKLVLGGKSSYISGNWLYLSSQLHLMRKFIITLLLIAPLMSTAQKPTLNHIAIWVVDLKTSTHFYQHIIGLDTIPEPFHDGKHTWFSVGPKSHLHIIQGAPEATPHPKNSHLCFSAGSVADFIRILEKNNIEYENWAGEKNAVTNRVDGVKQIYFKDPDGYWIEINDARE